MLVLCEKKRLLIGGSLDQNSPILNLLTGKNVAFITAAGDNPQEDGVTMKNFFARRGINSTWIPVFFPCRSRANFDENVELVEKADAIYFSGGFSEKLQKCLFGDKDVGTSDVLEAIQKKDWVGGSSAGAMVMPQRYMLLTGNASSSYSALVRRTLPIAPETFKLSSRGVIDPHMSERARQGRLLVFTVLAKNRFGFGLDENTGYLEHGDGSLTVMGQRGIVVYDRGANFSQIPILDELKNIRTHYLSEGDKLTKEGEVIIPPWKNVVCTPQRTEPRPSPQIFNGTEFRTRMIQVSRYERDIVFKGFHGQRPNVVFVEMEKHSKTKAACGTFNGATYTSVVDLKVSMGVTTLDKLKNLFKDLPEGFIPKEFIEPKPYIDY